MKFEIDSLVEEMLNQLPETVWTSDSTTFLDPAIGGGQFVRAIEQRLRKAGHSNANICNRVFGFEASNLHIRFAVNKYKLVGQYVRKSYQTILEMDNNMKFDVVVGNPPYEATDNAGRKDQANNLWSKFTKKGMDLVKDNGFMSFVTPTSWLSPAADIGKGKHGIRFFNEYFQKYKTHTLNVNECARHFAVGSTFSYFVVEKAEANKFETNVVTENSRYKMDLRTVHYLPKTMNSLAISINKKVLEIQDKFGIVGNNLPECRVDISKTQTDQFSVPTYHTNSKGGNYWYIKNPISTAANAKVIISLSGSYVPIYDQGGMSFTTMCVVYYLKKNDSMDSIQSFLNSKLVKFILSENKYTGWVSPVISDLPNIDKTKIWSNSDLYDHFDLTQEEIDYVETSIA
jgi:hypothetical protein